MENGRQRRQVVVRHTNRARITVGDGGEQNVGEQHERECRYLVVYGQQKQEKCEVAN